MPNAQIVRPANMTASSAMPSIGSGSPAAAAAAAVMTIMTTIDADAAPLKPAARPASQRTRDTPLASQSSVRRRSSSPRAAPVAASTAQIAYTSEMLLKSRQVM